VTILTHIAATMAVVSMVISVAVLVFFAIHTLFSPPIEKVERRNVSFCDNPHCNCSKNDHYDVR
jgi:hypothetical protein